MKKVIALILVLTFMFTMAVSAHPFNDVKGHWAEAEIEKGYASNVINGDGDGCFRPDDTITRGEFLKMITVLVCEKMSIANSEEITIPDDMGDDTHWASKYKTFANAFLFTSLREEIDGIYAGTMNSAEDYDKAITRWEMAYMLSSAICNLTGREMSAKELTFTDNATISEYPEAVATTIATANDFGFMKGDENNNFAPKASGTRAEAVTVINRMDDYLQGIIDEMNKAEDEYYEDLKQNFVTYDEIPKGHPQATILMENNKKIVIELYPEYAPQTVANFVKLAKEGFYDGTTFHRIVEGFVAQGGDPKGDGTGDSRKYILGEFTANGVETNTLKHTRGVISMARSQDFNSASSQFFICYDTAENLDGQYAAFGKVKSGMEVVDSFTKGEMTMSNSGEMSLPIEPIVIKKITIK